MKLMSLKIENFKGIESFEITPNGKNVDIFGKNGVGKSSIFDAFIWLLFNKDSSGQQDFDIKPLDSKNQVKNHEAVTKVKASVVQNEKEITLEKRYFEKWRTPRGKIEKIFDGHTTECFIDDLEIKITQFNERLNQFCNMEVFKILSDPKCFHESIPWETRRSFLFELADLGNEEDVFLSNPELKELKNLKENHSVSDFLSILKREQSEKVEKLNELPGRIKELHSQLEEDFEDVDAIKQDIFKTNSELAELEKQLAESEFDGFDRTTKNNLRKTQEIISKHEQDNREHQLNEREKFLEETSNQRISLTEKINERQSKKHAIQKQLTDIVEQIKFLDNSNQQLRIEWDKVNKSVYSDDEKCPTCGQVISRENVQETKENFNLTKSRKLSKISSLGKEQKEQISILEKNSTDTESYLVNLDTEIILYSTQLNGISIENLKTSNTPGYELTLQKLKEEEERLKVVLNNEREEKEKFLDPLQVAIQEVKNLIKKKSTNLTLANENSKKQRRLNELKAETKEISSQLEKIERKINLCNEFYIAQTKILQQNVNSMFEITEFKLFKTLVNGNIAEICEAMVDGILYSSSLNTANKMNSGIDVINVLSKHYGFSVPIFIDNAESVIELQNTNAQVIRLIVSDKYDELYVKPEIKMADTA